MFYFSFLYLFISVYRHFLATLQVTWLALVLYLTDWAASIVSTVFMRLNHLNLLSEFIYPLVRQHSLECLKLYAL